MHRVSKDEVTQALARQRALPLFNCGDAATGKVFSADTLGGPAFIKGVRGPCAWLSLMPSGGVTLDEANLKAWFAAGVHCVGMGSHLVDAKTLAEGTFADLAERVRKLTAILATV